MKYGRNMMFAQFHYLFLYISLKICRFFYAVKAHHPQAGNSAHSMGMFHFQLAHFPGNWHKSCNLPHLLVQAHLFQQIFCPFFGTQGAVHIFFHMYVTPLLRRV
nr:hypothetical protein [Eisenbergiella massiliensis]